jgi:anti-sigma factor (TIGR02949 family)
MTCQDARMSLLEYQRGRLRPAAREAIRAHLESCAECTREEGIERVLDDALEQRMPQYAAPLALKRRLAAQWRDDTRVRHARWSGWGSALVPALAVAAVLLAVLPLYYQRAGDSTRNGPAMVTEAVNDHLRILSSEHPVAVESGGIHQVKPWFEGRLDFAPVLAFGGDEEFPLQGGAVGYYLDRKAAVFVFHRRLHTISLFVFRAEGLPWTGRGLEQVGNVMARVTTSRGFNVILWRSGELGYALVSDVDRHELTQLATKLSG